MQAVAVTGSEIAAKERLEPIPCFNCGVTIAENFCPRCGQSRHDHSRSLRSYLGIVLEHHLMLDTKTMRTLFALLCRPGFLTNGYIEGHRARYGTPVKTYILVSFAFFLMLYFSGFALIQFHLYTAKGKNGDTDAYTYMQMLAPPQPETEIAGLIQNAHMDYKGEGAEYVQRMIDGFQLALQHPRMMNAALDEWMPRLLFLLLPFAALLLIIFSRRRGLYFVDHLAFSLHLQSFVFALATIAILVRLIDLGLPIGVIIIVATAIYMVLAYRRVYGSSWIGSVFKVCMIGFIYSIVLAIGFAGVFSIGLYTLPG